MTARQVFVATAVVLLTYGASVLVLRLVSLIILLLIAFIFASAIAPAVTRLNRRLSLPVSIAVVYLGLILTFALLAAVILQPLVTQAAEFIRSVPGLLGQAQTRVVELQRELDIPTNVASPDLVRNYGQLIQRAPALAAGLLNVTLGFISELAALLLILVIAFYWLLERRNIEGTWLALVPRERRPVARTILTEIEVKLGGYVRGQLTLGVIVGVLSYIGLFLLDMPFTLVLGLISGIGELIPLAGPFIGAAPAVLLALSVSPTKALQVIVLYVVIQQVENNFLVPKVMERSVGLSPLTVLVAVLVGTSLLGIVGALISVPVASAISVILRHTLFKERQEQYAQPPGSYDRGYTEHPVG